MLVISGKSISIARCFLISNCWLGRYRPIDTEPFEISQSLGRWYGGCAGSSTICRDQPARICSFIVLLRDSRPLPHPANVSLCPTQVFGGAVCDALEPKVRTTVQLPAAFQCVRTSFANHRSLRSGPRRFLAQELANNPYTVVGDSTQTRDFVYVSAVVDAFVPTADSEVTGGF